MCRSPSPAIAQLLPAEIQANPGSATSQEIGSIFGTGGCTHPRGTMARASDGIIDICKVATNSINMAILAPDVQIFDANGNYAPNAANTKKDSLRIAVGFTAVKATF